MTGKIIEMLVPTVEARKGQGGLAPRVNDLDNKVIGFTDNRWETYIPFLKRIEELLSERYRSSRIVRKTKMTKSDRAPVNMIDELATSCQVIINGLCA